MKKLFSGYHRKIALCLLVVAGILYICSGKTAYAFSYVESNLTGDTTDRTNYEEPGSATSQEDLAQINIGNMVTVSYSGDNGGLNSALRILIILTLIAVCPSLLVMLTAFTRIIIVLHFTRAALNTNTAPPNNVLIGLALFLTFFIMQPTLTSIYNDAVIPYDAGEITNEEAITAAIEPIREFMYGQTQEKDVVLFMDISRTEWSGELADIPLAVLIPSFIIGELRQAFIIGFLIYIPFLVIDMVVAATLMSMGMMMLPPTTISMPFKILLFVLADGWYLIVGSLVQTFY